MRALKVSLWISGLLCLLGVVGLVLPLSVFKNLAAAFGIDQTQFPSSPLTEYIIRLMLATSVMIGIFFIMLAKDPMKYGIFVPFAGLGTLFLGIACILTGFFVKMPTIWYLGDSLPCIILGTLILTFWNKAKHVLEQ